MRKIIKKTVIVLGITTVFMLALFLVCDHIVTRNAEDLRGVEAIAINAKDGKIWKYPPRRIIREWISRAKLFIDEWTHAQPHFMGEPIEIGGQQESFPSMKIDTTTNLIVYYPDFSRIDLVCDTMPSKEDKEVIFCAEAAFTAKLLDSFSHKNICGPHEILAAPADG